MISCKVVLDSSFNGRRLTTLEVTMHRYVLAEMNTHRVFSRNSASSRAIPFATTVQRVIDSPAIPVEWGVNRAGMWATEVLGAEDASKAERAWLAARDSAVEHARRLNELGVHKQVVNRLLEPFMWHTVIITSEEWANFWRLRCHSDAQPEMQAVARQMRAAYESSTPAMLGNGEWHLPYVGQVRDPSVANFAASVARCARVSYNRHTDDRTPDEDIALFRRLLANGHASPMEHQAVAGREQTFTASNFKHWGQLRHNMPFDLFTATQADPQ